MCVELTRPTGLKGKRSRNKAAVGEPTAGSLPIFDLMLDPSIIFTECNLPTAHFGGK